MTAIIVSLTPEEINTICHALYEQSLVETERYNIISYKMARCKLLLQLEKKIARGKQNDTKRFDERYK